MPALQTNRTALVGLQRIEILAGLELALLEDLSRRLHWHQVRTGERVISREDPDRNVYLVVGGRVQVAAFSSGGRQVTYREIGAGEIFGELAAIDGRGRSADVTALEDSLLAAMKPETFMELVFSNAVVGEKVLLRLTSSVREMTDRVFQLSTLGVRNRVHAELLRLARLGTISGNVARIDPAPRHGEIANRVSTYREQVTRELSLLAAQGLLERDGRCMVVRDLTALERMVAEVGQLG